MDPRWLSALAIVFGIVVGSGVTILIVLAGRRGQVAAEVAAPRVPEGIAAVLPIVDAAAVVVDPSGNVLAANQRAAAYGMVWQGRLEGERFVEIAARARAADGPIEEELGASRGRLAEQTLDLAVRATRIGARFVLILAADRGEANRVDQSRRDFIANISHELKTPIGAVGLLAEALQLAADDPEQVTKFAKQLVKEAARLGALTGDIIELSRLQSIGQIAEAAPVDMDRAVQQAIDRNRVSADGKDIALVTGKRTAAVVMGDQKLLVTAINNLIANAIAYSPEHTRVGVGLRLDDGIVEVSVADQGIGIPEADRERVFERFYRVDGARARSTGGTGLGLAIVKHIVQSHGGEVRVWSQPRRGSTFTIRIPAAGAHAAAQPPIPQQQGALS